MESRDYQEKVINDVVNSHDNVIIESPTGSGKTYIAKRITAELPCKVLFVTPRIDLVHQAVRAFGDNVDLIMGRKDYIASGRKVIVASRNTLLRRPVYSELYRNCVMIFDEVHIGLEATPSLVEKYQPIRVIGLTATPERMDGLSFIRKELCSNTDCVNNKDRFSYAIFDRVVQAGTIKSLQEQGYLAPLKYEVMPNKGLLSLSKRKSRKDELNYKDFQEFVETQESIAKAAAWLQDKPKPYIVFTPDINSAKSWTETFNKFGYKFIQVDGSMDGEDRQDVYQAVKDGKYDGIINCALLTYGFDMPSAKTAILIRNIKSRPLYIQIIGRILRPFNNLTAHVLDLAGSNWNFCSLSKPNLFDYPIHYQTEGFEFGESQERWSNVDDIIDLVGEGEVENYVNNPLQTLLRILCHYKEDYEVRLHEIRMKYERKLNNLQSESNELRSRLKSRDSEVRLIPPRSDVIQTLRRLYGKSDVNPREWFAKFGKTWFRTTLVHNVLKPLKYDKSKVLNHDVRQAVWDRMLQELPFDVDKFDNDTKTFVYKRCGKELGWWLENFELDYKRTA